VPVYIQHQIQKGEIELMTINYETIEYELMEDGIGLLSLNRPRKFNMVNEQMMEELESFWNDKLYDLDTHVIILRGNGTHGFCAGLDIRASMKLFEEMNAEAFYRFQGRLARLTLAMRRVPQPIVCAVHGPAVGLGFSFALASDIRVISKEARFAAAFINIGLGGADMACSYFLPRLIGAGRAYEFMLTGDFISADEAMLLGLGSRLVDSDNLLDEVRNFARTLNGKNPMGLRLTKEAINMNIDAGGLEQALNIEDRNQALLVTRGMPADGKKTSRYF
jgi:enoyl-CoA hydratase/carnithine racemase